MSGAWIGISAAIAEFAIEKQTAVPSMGHDMSGGILGRFHVARILVWVGQSSVPNERPASSEFNAPSCGGI